MIQRKVRNVFLIIILTFTSAVSASSLQDLKSPHENSMFIGVRFNINEQLHIDINSIQPWTTVCIGQSHPNDVNLFRVNEMHHLYAGIVLWLTGYATDTKLLKVAGQVLVIDDAIQHIFRINTPIHMLNGGLWRYQWYRDLCNIGAKIGGEDH